MAVRAGGVQAPTQLPDPSLEISLIGSRSLELRVQVVHSVGEVGALVLQPGNSSRQRLTLRLQGFDLCLFLGDGHLEPLLVATQGFALDFEPGIQSHGVIDGVLGLVGSKSLIISTRLMTRVGMFQTQMQ